jgi:hypothetical protein
MEISSVFPITISAGLCQLIHGRKWSLAFHIRPSQIPSPLQSTVNLAATQTGNIARQHEDLQRDHRPQGELLMALVLSITVQLQYRLSR